MSSPSSPTGLRPGASDQFDFALLLWQATYDPGVIGDALEEGITRLQNGGVAAVAAFCRSAAEIASVCASDIAEARIVSAGRLADRAARNIVVVIPPPFNQPLADLATAAMTDRSAAGAVAAIERHARADIETAVGAALEAVMLTFRTFDVSLQAAGLEPAEAAMRLRATTMAVRAERRRVAVPSAGRAVTPPPAPAPKALPPTVASGPVATSRHAAPPVSTPPTTTWCEPPRRRRGLTYLIGFTFLVFIVLVVTSDTTPGGSTATAGGSVPTTGTTLRTFTRDLGPIEVALSSTGNCPTGRVLLRPTSDRITALPTPGRWSDRFEGVVVNETTRKVKITMLHFRWDTPSGTVAGEFDALGQVNATPLTPGDQRTFVAEGVVSAGTTGPSLVGIRINAAWADPTLARTCPMLGTRALRT